MENKICVTCGMEYPNHKMSCKGSVKEYRLPTAEEFLTNKYSCIYEKQCEGFKNLPKSRFLEMHITGRINGTEQNVLEMMVEFAKLHVEQALKEASEKATVTPIDHIEISEGSFRPIWGVDDDSILNSYPLDKIK